jgi:peroxiredoxin
MMDTEEKQFNYPAAIIVFLTFTVFLAVLSLKQDGSLLKFGEQASIKVGLPAPDFTYPGLDGKMVSLSDYRGKVVLVNIWATWCKPCVDEMPSMEKLYQNLKGEDFEILAVSIDSQGSKVVAPFMKKYKLTFPALIDSMGTIKKTYKTTGVPESFIINKDGFLVKKVIGPLDWSHPDVLSLFRELIQRPITKKE